MVHNDQPITIWENHHTYIGIDPPLYNLDGIVSLTDMLASY